MVCAPNLRAARTWSVDPNEKLARVVGEADRVLVMRAFGQNYVPTDHRPEDALAIVDIRVLDHLIVAGAQVVSLAERGVL